MSSILCLLNEKYPVVFPKMYFLEKERMMPCFFATFHIIINHIFFENIIEIPQFVQKI